MAPGASTAAAEVLNSGYVGEGPQVKKFEEEFQQHLGAHQPPLMVNSGTSALDLAYELCNIPEGAEVITTPLTCTATNLPLLRRRVKIVWADCNVDTGLISKVDLLQKLNRNTAAIVAVAWGGRIPEMPPINLNTRVILDLAHAPQPLRDSDRSSEGSKKILRCWSFQAIKHLTTVDGGALLPPTPSDRERGRLLRWFGLDRESSVSFRCSQDIKEPGFKYQMHDVAASIGRCNLLHLPIILSQHRHNARILYEIFSEYPDEFRIPHYDPTAAYWIFTVLVRQRRDALQKFLQHRGIESGLVHSRNDIHTCFRKVAPVWAGQLPGVDYFQAHQLAVPCGWWVTEENLYWIAKCIKSWVET